MAAALYAGTTVLALAACGSTNAGGATSCGDFTRMSSDDQKSVIATMLDDQGSSTSNGNISLTQLSAVAYCATVGSDSSPISNIDHG